MNSREIIPLKQKPNWQVTLPGSKSITNRVFLCAALAKGKSKIHGALESDDTIAMLNALRKLEIRNSKLKNLIEIKGCGGNFKSGNLTINAGASGTTTRFLTALSILRDGKTIIKGDKRMMERPMKDLNDALSQIRNAKSEIRKYIKIKGDKSSQFLSALLIISPLIGPIKIEVIGELVSKPYIDITISVMKAFGVKVKNNSYKSFEIKSQFYKADDYHVEGDASSASYWTSIAYLHNGKVRFTNLNKRSIQGDIRFADMLTKLGSTVDMESMPDTAITLAVTAPFKKGQTKITGLSTLRLKETDRLKALKKELEKIGVNANVTKDSITINPLRITDYELRRNPESVIRNPIKTYNDHRMAMCFAVVGTMISGVVIEDPNCVNKTYPHFWNDLELAYLNPIKLDRKNLVLTGMRCSGKTYLGKKIAKLLKRKFVDLDIEIEKRENMKIKDIVKAYGWPRFRDIEQKMCSLFANQKNLVIATGGGVVLSEKNMKNLKKNAVNIFIFTDPSAIVERLKKESKNRPALTGGGSDKEVQKIWEERRNLYLKYADIVWDNTSGKIVEKKLAKIFI